MYALSLGIQFTLIILIFIGLGYWLDQKYNTGVLFLLLFLFAGFAIAFYTLIKSATKERDDDNNEK